MTERNPVWLPIVQRDVKPDPVERTLRLIWSYEATPPRVSLSQRYSLALVEPLPSPRTL